MLLFQWKHIFHLLKRVSKNIEILYKTKNIVSEGDLKRKYFCLVHSYVNYRKMASRSITRARLNALTSKKRQDVRVIYAAEHANEKNWQNKSFEYLQTQDLSSIGFYV